jgi:cytochrome c peroxidase
MAAISASAERGEILFSSSERGGCFQCHGGWNFTAVRFEGSEERNIEGDARGFFNTGVSQYLPPNHGLYEYTMRSEDIGKFRPPTLQNMAITAPYTHEGSLSTLEEVIDYYAAGGEFDHHNKTRILRRLRLKL